MFQILEQAEKWLGYLKCPCGSQLKIYTTDISNNSAEIGCPDSEKPGIHVFQTIRFDEVE